MIPSIQNIIDCSGMGCNGGDSNAANKWIHDNGGIPDVTCQQYEAKNGNCSAEHTCMNCGGPHCWAVQAYPKVGEQKSFCCSALLLSGRRSSYVSMIVVGNRSRYQSTEV